jgi:hypothetical protein
MFNVQCFFVELLKGRDASKFNDECRMMNDEKKVIKSRGL